MRGFWGRGVEVIGEWVKKRESVMVEAGTDELCLENVDHVVKVMESEGLLID